MKTTDSINKDRQPYGTINLSLAQQLYKENDCSALMLHLYIGARRNLKDSRWEFNVPDISTMTAVDRRVLAKHIKRLQSEGVFIPAGLTSKGASKFTLNQQEYDRRYVNVQEQPCASNVHLDQPLCASNVHPDRPRCTSDAYTSNAQGSAVCASNVHAGVHPMHTPCASNEHTDVHPVQGGCASNVHHDVHPMYTKNKDKEAREQSRQKERKEEANSCLPSSLPASRLSEVITKFLNPFSQPMFVEDPDRPAPRNDDSFSTEPQENKSGSIKGSEAGQSAEKSKTGKSTSNGSSSLLKDAKPYNYSSEESQSGNNTVSALSSIVTDAIPYNYTIDGTTHEIFFDEQESNSALSPAEKVTVLKHALVPFITTGEVDMPRASVLQVTGKSFERARQLFEVNPALPVSSLLKVVWECNRVACENPVKDSGFKPCFTHRAATESLTYLLKNLDTINGTMPEELRLSDNTVFLTVE